MINAIYSIYKPTVSNPGLKAATIPLIYHYNLSKKRFII